MIRRLDYSTKDELQEDHPLFAAHADDYMQFAPAAAVYGLNLLGIKGKHSLLDATGLYVLSSAIMGGSVTALKKATHRLRPNGSGYTSFPSGHTANAFAAAEFLKQEYKDVSPWYGYAGYTVAIANLVYSERITINIGLAMWLQGRDLVFFLLNCRTCYILN
ncbi:hypothetical protein [Pedobacter panaciterrae]